MIIYKSEPEASEPSLRFSLQIVASEDLRGTLRGLCGDYDDILDIELIDTRSFVTQWRVDSNDIR